MNLFGEHTANSKLRFSGVESFRLCTQGLRALEQYESSTSKDDLRRAEQQLDECVRLHPSDVLPKFYLGSVKTLMGYDGLDYAKLLFQEVIDQGDATLSFAAKYNLAVAYVETYTAEGFSKAEELLAELIAAKPAGRSREKTIWSARATLLYIRADRIWRNREEPRESDCLAASKLMQDMDAFAKSLEKSPFREDPDILSGQHNARGTLLEFLARASRERDHDDYATRAKVEFESAAAQKVSYVNSMSNLARLEGEVFGNRELARKMWNRLLNMGKSGEYIHYNLGMIDEFEGDKERDLKHKEEALKHYEAALKHYQIAAPQIDEAKAAYERLSEALRKN